MKNFKNKYTQASILILALFSLSNVASAEPFTLDCGDNKTYKDFRLIVDLNSKNIKEAFFLDGNPNYWTDFIIYEVNDNEILAHSDDKYFTEKGVFSFYMVLNRYNLHWFGATGESWIHPAKNGIINGGGAVCKKLEKVF